MKVKLEVKIPYGREEVTVDVDRGNLIGIFDPVEIGDLPEERSEIARSIENPIGCEPLDRLVAPGKTVAIAVDDNTRITPQKAMTFQLSLLWEHIGILPKKR